MTLDVLTTVLSYALVYAGVYYGDNSNLTVNWNAINATTWWGLADAQANQNISVTGIKLHYDKDLLSDLKMRLTRNVSYVAPLEGVASRYGWNSNTLPEWLNYWATSYDFAGRLAKLNKYPLYTTNVQGLDIAFYRISPRNPDKKPKVTLLMLHGFPSSPVEFLEAIDHMNHTDILNGRDFLVEVIVPCLPGFGYSSGSVRAGLGAAQAAVVMNSLMLRLGQHKYYVHGSDLGSLIASDMATLFPENVLGYISFWPRVLSPFAYGIQLIGQLMPSLFTDASTYDRVYPNYDIYSRMMENIAYIHWHATKPDTAGIPLTDSAAGLLVWVLDIIGRETNYGNLNQTDLGLSALDKDKLLDNLMFYWAPKPVTTAGRVCADTYNKVQAQYRLDEIATTVPTYAVQTKYALTFQPAAILKMKYPNLVEAEVLDFGGHFLGFENPKAVASSVNKALVMFRNQNLTSLIHRNASDEIFMKI